jgi:DNA-binding transcriptional ArsR family regulator
MMSMQPTRYEHEWEELRDQRDALLAALKLCRNAINEEILAADDLDHPTIRAHAKAAEQADLAIAKVESAAVRVEE